MCKEKKPPASVNQHELQPRVTVFRGFFGSWSSEVA